MDLGSHAVFIIVAYAVAFVVVGGMIAWVVADHAILRRAIGALEARGVTRRSARDRAATPGRPS